MMNAEEFQRYSRQIIIPEIGLEGQKKLLNAKVLVIGAGGLGCPALLYLAAAGVGQIGIIDFDHVDRSNLQRQILFREDDSGQPKVECAAARLHELNKSIKVEKIKLAITADSALDMIAGYDVIIDTSDNFLTRYVVNDASFIRQIPLIYGSIFRLEGQVSVFNLDKDAPCYRCLFPAPPPQEMIPSCSAGGALGALAGLIGSLQAAECIKIILRKGEMMSGKLMKVNLLDLDFITLGINKSGSCTLCSQARMQDKLDPNWYQFPKYEPICRNVKRVSDKELIAAINDKSRLLRLIDVREKWELADAKNASENTCIPLSVIEKNPSGVVGLLSHQGKNVFYCEDGSRSEYAISLIEREFGYSNLYSYKGNPHQLFSNVERER